jgi:hypothetical protein
MRGEWYATLAALAATTADPAGQRAHAAARPDAVGVALFDLDQAGRFEDGDVLGEVAGGQLQVGAQVAELDAACFVWAKPNAPSSSTLPLTLTEIRPLRLA